MYKKLMLLLTLFGHELGALEPLRNNIQRGERRVNSLITRNIAGRQQSNQPLQTQFINGDEARYADKRNSFGKSLAQLSNGLINVDAFDQLVAALRSGDPSLFNHIMMGSSPLRKRLVNPQAAYAFNLDGADSWIDVIPAPPALTSAEAGGEMVELYWQALLRDVAFNDYDTNALALAAIADLNNLTDYNTARSNGVITPQTLFRSDLPSASVGPYISQFLYQPIPYGPGPNFNGSGALPIQYQEQVVPTSSTVNDFMTNFNEWEFIQQGHNPTRTIAYTATRTFIRNGRDLGDYLRQDYPQQAFLNAALILLAYGAKALDQNNPYKNNLTQQGFTTYGQPDLLNLVTMAMELALRATWYQKWLVHLRARPEFIGFLVQQQKTGAQNFGLHIDLMSSNALAQTFATFGSYFLPQAYPEGSPVHPSYPAGHAAIAGACVTILKAFFNEDFAVPSPVEPNALNTALVAYSGTLKVGDELNKLASNFAEGRDIAGVHFRSDGVAGLNLGEKVAIALLNDEALTRHEPFAGFKLTTFDGRKITVGAKRTPSQL